MLSRLLRLFGFHGRVDHHLLEVISGAKIAAFFKLLNAGVAFVFNIVLSRLLGAEASGRYFLALTVVTIAAAVGCFGLDKSMLRFIAAKAAEGDWAAVNDIYKKGIFLALAASVLSTAALFFLAPVLTDMFFGKPELSGAFRLMAFAVLPFAMMTVYSEILKGLKRIRDSMIVQGFCLYTLLLAGTLLLADKWGLNGAIASYIAAASASALLGYLIWRLAVPKPEIAARRSFEVKVLLKSATPLFWITIINLSMISIINFVLGAFGTEAEIGIFNAAFRTAMLISFVLTAVNSMAAPKFAELFVKGNMTALDSTARSSAKFTSLLALPVFLVFALFPGRVISMFGPEFAAGAQTLMILSVAQMFNVVAGSVGPILMMTGHETAIRDSMIVGAALNLVLCLTLIPPFGGLGAAISYAFSLISINVYCVYMIKRKLGINLLSGILPFAR